MKTSQGKKSQMMIAISATAMAALAVANAAFAGEETQGSYRLRDIPAQEGQSCEEFAMNLGQQLKDYVGGSIAGFDVLETRCFQDISTMPAPKNAWNVEITYAGDAQLKRVSTNDTGVSMFQPAYKDRESCEAGMAAEIPQFERQTGLTKFFAYCTAPRYTSDGWEVSIEAFGTPRNRPFSDNLPVFGKIVGHTWESFTAMLSAGLAKFGFELAQAEMSSKLAFAEVVFRYYGDRSLSPHGHEVAYIPTPEQCLAEVTRVQTALDQAGFKTLGVFCWGDRVQGLTQLEIATDGDRALRLAQPETTYETWEVCEASREGVADNYRNRYKHNVIAALCNYDWKNKYFNVTLVEQPR
ncbi:MAG: hypothetical protein RIQ81_619 [Pseudomonadota bacterium]